MLYEYTGTVASKLFNFASAFSNLNVSEYLSNPQTCQCKESKFCYEPLQELALESTNFDYSSAEYRVIAIILDIANYRLFRPVRSDVPAEKPKHFMKIKFLNKAVDAINLPALLRSTSVTDKIPVYFRDKEPPIVSYNTLALLPANYLTLHQPFQT